jgi:hypothetical protein
MFLTPLSRHLQLPQMFMFSFQSPGVVPICPSYLSFPHHFPFPPILVLRNLTIKPGSCISSWVQLLRRLMYLTLVSTKKMIKG